MRKTMLLAAVVGIAVYSLFPGRAPESKSDERTSYGRLTIDAPFDGAVFPPEIAPPTFRWSDDRAESSAWRITITFTEDSERMTFLTREPRWEPGEPDWERIKSRSREKEAQVSVSGLSPSGEVHSRGSAVFSTSADEVGAPIFYREVSLPFSEAVKDPSKIRWRFGPVSSTEQPPVVLEGLPVCGNCHSFSADGTVLGMDVDYANDKGSYALTAVSDEIVLDPTKIITWSDFPTGDRSRTYGLLSQVSPDGKVAISTVKDRSVFVPRPDLYFSQLFFPLKGILGVYSRETGLFRSLPGADDPRFVQSNPSWSPDGKHLVFARAEAYELQADPEEGRVLLTQEECREFLEEGKPFKYDLYRVPYNDGNGGEPKPLQGASRNGVSNYFAKYSPDGKWIVFCKSDNYMLLQPDSELYIMPAEGGEARRMRCNTSRMNSWHSWSPNSRWLVFSSKENGPYTQLFLAHVDEEGRSSPPVLLSRFTAPDRAANIPEFVNVAPGAIRRIHERFVDDHSLVRAAIEFAKAGDDEAAIRKYEEALQINPRSVEAHCYLGWLFIREENYDEAIRSFSEAVEIDPDSAVAHSGLATALAEKGLLEEATVHFRLVTRLAPDSPAAEEDLALALYWQEEYEEAIVHCTNALRMQPDLPDSLVRLGSALFRTGRRKEAIEHWKKALAIRPEDAVLHHTLGQALSEMGERDQALEHHAEALRLDPDYAEAQVVLAHARLEENPDDTDVRYVLGNALARLGMLDEAVLHLRWIVKLQPDHVGAHGALARTLARQGKHDLAAQHLVEVLRVQPENVNALVNLGACYAEVKRFPDAISVSEKALALARAAGRGDLAERIEKRIGLYRQGRSWRPTGDPPLRRKRRSEQESP